MDFVDVKYINLLSVKLQKFKKVKSNLYNFRCPLCGDSKTNKNKARGYLYQVKNNTNYKCHNCGVNISFNNFLKALDIELHKKYVFEKFKDGKTGKNFTAETPKFFDFKPEFKEKINLNLPKASENENAKKFLEDRKLDPNNYYYTERFKEWTNTLKQTFDDISVDEPRIIIPLIYKDTFVGFQGRCLKSSLVKYITIMLDENCPKIYGIDNIDKNKTVYITEGPFDSFFIENSIALCGADGDIKKYNIRDYVWIYDNEPRNNDIVKRIKKVIDSGDKIVIWPTTIQQKDINDLIIDGYSKEEVMKIIRSNSYDGLEANLKFNIWKKV